MNNNNAPSRRHNSNYVNDNNNSNIDITVAELNGRNMDDSNNGFSGGEGTGYLMSMGNDNNNNNYNDDDEENFAADYADTTTDDNDDDVVIVEGDDLVTREQQRDRGDDIDEGDGGDDGDKDINTNNATYPADCYSFLALYSPLDHLGFW